ncbi:DUF6922 domain-containing protein [Dyadobacter frigoris]
MESVFERGNSEEKDEITRFYGEAKVQSVLMAQQRKLPLINRKKL